MSKPDSAERALIIDHAGRYMGEIYTESPPMLDLLLEFKHGLASVGDRRWFTRVEVPRASRSPLWLYVEVG